MKYTFIFALAMLLFTACDKEEPQFSPEDDLTLFKPDPGKMMDKVVVTEDINVAYLNGFEMKKGEHYQVRDHPELLEFFIQELGVNPDDYPIESARGKRSIAHRFIFVSFDDDCIGDPEVCPELGQELQGFKGSSYQQIRSAPSYNPFQTLIYKYDPKPLNNISDDYNYHYYRHINYNGSGTIEVGFYCYNHNLDAWFVDRDDISISDYGQHTFFDVWSEAQTLSDFSTDENAVRWSYSSCCY